MRRNQLLSVPMFLGMAMGVAACQMDSGEFDEGEVGSAQQATTGGGPALNGDHYSSVAAITVLRPAENGERTKFYYCTGVLIGPQTVLTSADCVYENLEAELEKEEGDDEEYLDAASIYVQFGSSVGEATQFALDASFNVENVATKGLAVHRHFNEDNPSRNNVALLRLSEAPPAPAEPAALYTAPITSEDIGTPIEFVGYGKELGDGQEDTFTGRNAVTDAITTVSGFSIRAGSEGQTTCLADSGGPGFIVVDDEPLVASVSRHHNDCVVTVNRQRVDVYVEEFLEPFKRYSDDGCADCDNCELNGVCEEDCPTRDWDCELGSVVGEPCTISGECEELGECVPASDDPDFTYCDKPCEQSDPAACAPGMTCNEDGRCVYEGISPGSQGAACTAPGDCRSGFCENSFCANECDPAGDTCDTENGFFCLPSTEDGSTTVCRTELRTGGGGFCHAGSGPHLHEGERNSLLAGLGLLFVFGLFRRRRTN